MTIAGEPPHSDIGMSMSNAEDQDDNGSHECNNLSGMKPLYWSALALCKEVVWIQHLGLHICTQKCGTRLGLVRFSFKEVMSYLRKVSGVVETCGCGRSGLGSDVEAQ